MTAGPFRHEAVPYDGLAQFVPTGTALVRNGLERSERVIVLAVGEKVEAVREELGPDAEDVTFVATDTQGRNPSRITTILHGFQSAGDGRHALGVNETLLAGRSGAAQDEAHHTDSMLDLPAVTGWPLSVICLYDTATLDAPSLASMARGHEHVRGCDTNPDFVPDLAATTYASPLAAPPLAAVGLAVTGTGLADTRNLVRTRCAAFGIAADRADDLVLAVNEVITNSLRYGGGTAQFAMWFEDGSAVCEISDHGYLADPLAGRLAPSTAAASGRGLWLVNHLCDLVQLRSAPGRTTVRLFVDR